MPSIRISVRSAALLAAGILLAGGLWAFVWFQPARQLANTFERFVAAGERRAWDKVEDFLADDYHDQWGFDRATATATAREIFGQFFVLEITPTELSVEISGNTGTVSCIPRLAGNGTAFAQMVLARANALDEPTVFVWRRESWKPWDWKLTGTSQPAITATGF